MDSLWFQATLYDEASAWRSRRNQYYRSSAGFAHVTSVDNLWRIGADGGFWVLPHTPACVVCNHGAKIKLNWIADYSTISWCKD